MHPTDGHIHIGLILAGIVTGGGGVRFLVYVSKSLPPLKADAGWWAQLFYNLVKNTSGLDPSSAIMSQNTLRAITGTSIPTAAEVKS